MDAPSTPHQADQDVAASVQIRRPYKNAPHHDAEMVRSNGPVVEFRHPYYEDGNLLFRLPAYDTTPDGQVGLHHETARIACAIVANCNWNGYLSESRKGPRINVDAESILTGHVYYFHIDGETDYAIIPTFSDFRFPHGNLPPSWISPSVTIPSTINLEATTNLHEAVTERDRSCLVTKSTLAKDVAHFVDVAQEDWFRKNSMAAYMVWETASTSDPANCMLLRKDVHFLFNARFMTVVPKAGKWVLHVVRMQNSALVDAYHNVNLQPLSGISVEFIFARFASTVLSLIIFPFIGTKRRLILVSGAEANEKELEGDELRKIFPLSGRSKTRSSSKRQRTTGDDGKAEECCQGDVSGDYEEEEEHWLSNMSDDDPPRGRPRKRSFDRYSDETSPSDEIGGTEWQRYGRAAFKRSCLEMKAKGMLPGVHKALVGQGCVGKN